MSELREIFGNFKDHGTSASIEEVFYQSALHGLTPKQFKELGQRYWVHEPMALGELLFYVQDRLYSIALLELQYREYKKHRFCIDKFYRRATENELRI